jgi:hypothetical protein
MPVIASSSPDDEKLVGVTRQARGPAFQSLLKDINPQLVLQYPGMRSGMVYNS